MILIGDVTEDDMRFIKTSKAKVNTISLLNFEEEMGNRHCPSDVHWFCHSWVYTGCTEHEFWLCSPSKQ